MSSISAGTTTTTGYVVTSDTTGALVLKTGASATTALTIDTSQNVTFVGSQTFSGGTANGVLYLNGSKVATSGSALVFDGTNLGIGTSSPASDARLTIASANTESYVMFSRTNAGVFDAAIGNSGGSIVFKGGADSSTVAGLTEFMRLDSTGNLGLGVTPSAWASSMKAIQIGTLSSLHQNDSGSFYTSRNSYNSSTGYRYLTTETAQLFGPQSNGAFAWYNAPSGTAGNAITWTQAMTLTSGGHLGLGTTSPNKDGGSAITMTINSSNGARLELANGDAREAQFFASNAVAVLTSYNNKPMVFEVNGSERARIDSSGNLLVGTTSAGARLTVQQSGSSDVIRVNIGTGGTGYAVIGSGTTMLPAYFATSGGVTFAGQISCSGSTTSYATSSDYRLKNITGNLTGYKERLMSLQPKQGTWIADGSEFRGFLAHEFAQPYSASVSGEKDAVDAEGKPIMQSMQASSSEVMADLVALVQEQQAIIQQLQADVAALKGTA